MRQVDNKTNVIRKCDTSTNTLFVMEQACSNPQTDSPGPPSCWRHVDNLPINQLGFPLHFVKIFDSGARLDTHGSLSSAVWCPLMADLLHILINVEVLPPSPRVNALGVCVTLRLFSARYMV